jgi:hypothetical protein
VLALEVTTSQAERAHPRWRAVSDLLRVDKSVESMATRSENPAIRLPRPPALA